MVSVYILRRIRNIQQASYPQVKGQNTRQRNFYPRRRNFRIIGYWKIRISRTYSNITAFKISASRTSTGEESRIHDKGIFIRTKKFSYYWVLEDSNFSDIDQLQLSKFVSSFFTPKKTGNFLNVWKVWLHLILSSWVLFLRRVYQNYHWHDDGTYYLFTTMDK